MKEVSTKGRMSWFYEVVWMHMPEWEEVFKYFVAVLLKVDYSILSHRILAFGSFDNVDKRPRNKPNYRFMSLCLQYLNKHSSISTISHDINFPELIGSQP